MKPLFLFVGESGSGKTTIADIAENKGYSVVSSYTTREPRVPNEHGHIFITEEEFSALKNIVAYTFYNGYHYCTTQEQLDRSDIYVVDPDGVETLLNNYHTKRNITILYFGATVANRILRMQARGDTNDQIIKRLLNDEKEYWYGKLVSLSWKSNVVDDEDVELYKIRADENIDDVLNQVFERIQYVEGKHGNSM